MFTQVAENALRYFYRITEPCDANNSWYAAILHACVVLLSQPLESNTKARPERWLFSSKPSPSDGPTGRSGQVWDRAIAEATKPAHFVLSIELGTEGPKTAFRRGKKSKRSIMHKPHSFSRCQLYILQ
jgi:hypothetical protein